MCLPFLPIAWKMPPLVIKAADGLTLWCTPLRSTPTNPGQEIVEGYELGYTFDPEEPESIAEAINQVLADEQRYDTMKKNALEAARIFNWETESRKLLRIYQGLSQRTGNGTA